MNSHKELQLFTSNFMRPMKGLWLHEREEQREGWLQRLTTRRLARLEEHRQLQTLAEPWQPGIHVYGRDEHPTDMRVIGVIVWSRDCDHVCGESKYVIEASIKSYDEFRDKQSYWAEGPMTFRLCAPSMRFKPWSRDMVMEAYEDGHAHSVSDAYYPED